LTRAKGKGQKAEVRNLLPRVIFFSMEGWQASVRSLLLPFALCLLPLLVLLSGCRQDMHDAPRYDPLEASTAFPKGSSAQPLVEGTVSREYHVPNMGDFAGLREDEHLYTGKVNGQPVATFPFAITKADLDRGEERFNIYCSPCHGRTGEGDGMVVQRGFRQPSSYHIDRLRQAPAGYFFDVITNGFGAMPDYRSQVAAEDRWRIVAYIRALQLSHNATASDVPSGEKISKPGETEATGAKKEGGD
jgi:mono/diheme cytochrome c family protein